MEFWENTLRTKKNAKNPRISTNLQTLKISEQFTEPTESMNEREPPKKDMSFVGQLDLLTQAQEVLDIATAHLDLEIPFFQPNEDSKLCSDDMDQACECLFRFLDSLSRKTNKNFLELRSLLGRQYDNLIEMLVNAFTHSRRVNQCANTLETCCNEFRDLVYKFENAEHHIRKYKNVSSEVVTSKAKELEVNKNMLCMWDHKLQTLLVEVSRAIAQAYEFTLTESSMNIRHTDIKTIMQANSPKRMRKPTRFSTHSMSIDASPAEVKEKSSPVIDRSKSLSLSYDGSPFVQSLALETKYPSGIDPLIVFWLRKHSFSQYIPLFTGKGISFSQFSQMKDIHFTECGIESGEDCISLGMLLSNTNGPGNTVVVHESYICKRGHIRKNWKNRFFRLVSSYEIFYYSKPESRKALGSIDLLQVSSVSQVPGNVLQENSFYFYFELLTKDRCWLLRGDDVLVQQWCSLLQSAVLYCKENNITRSR